MKKYFLMALICLFFNKNLFAQKSIPANSILWEVSGNGLQKPSFLFGTYHFLTNAFIDTIPAVKNAYKSVQAVAGELIIDSSLQAPIMEASVLKGTTLQKILPDTLYQKVSNWFKEEAGLDLTKLDQLNPLTVMTAALAIVHQKYYPTKAGEVQLDTYFQDEAKKDGKKVIGLETVDVQIKAMFGQFNMQRQVELLNETFKEKDDLKHLIGIMNNAYISQNMNELQQLMYRNDYRPNEMKVLLDDRNNNWMATLPILMNEQATFVAVGALHLIGQKGLIEQLKQTGYTVTPVNLKN